MTYRELDTVVLERDLPSEGLCRGDVGTIVHLYSAETFEVEFLRASGATAALVTLESGDVRLPRNDDQLAVRRSAMAGQSRG